MRAEIISIGTELLVGSILNTNARFLSQKLAKNAMDVYYQTTVGDNIPRIVEAFENAAHRAEVLIASGGLGPTADDVTMEALSQFLGKPLFLHKPTYQHVLQRLRSRQYPMTRLIAKQCYVPQSSWVLKNHFGTAPGVLAKTTKNGKIIWILVLPGPPRELEPMFSKQALPLLIRSAKIPRSNFLIRSLKITGLVEAQVAQKVTRLLKLKPPVTVGIYAKPDEVELKIMSKHASKKKALSAVTRIEKEIRNKLKEKVMGTNNDTLSSVVGNLLKKKKKTLAIAESCTGGLVSNRITQTPGSSDYFLGGIICYSNAVKSSALNISSDLIKKKGAVSEEVAKKLAQNIRAKFGSDYGIGLSGIAGPSGGTKKKPVGLVYIALASANKSICHRQIFFGNRVEIQSRATNYVLNVLRLELI